MGKWYYEFEGEKIEPSTLGPKYCTTHWETDGNWTGISDNYYNFNDSETIAWMMPRMFAHNASGSGNARRGWSLDKATPAAEMEVVAVIAQSGSATDFFYNLLILHGSGNAAARSGYIATCVGGTNAMAIRRVENSTVETDLVLGTMSPAPAAGVAYFARFRATPINSGTETKLDLFIWQIGEAEPTVPTLTATDPNPLPVGWAGFGSSQNNSGDSYFGRIGVGTNGDVAPLHSLGSRYFTDFEDEAVGADPAGWTKQQSPSNTNVSIVDNGVGYGKCLKVERVTTQATSIVTWDLIDPDTEREDVEVLALMRGGGSDSSPALALRMLDDNNHYIAGQQPTLSTRIYKTLAGTQTGIYYSATNYGTNWVWLRAQMVGSTVRFKMWLENDPEPAVWAGEVIDQDINGLGHIGIPVNIVGGYVEVAQISVATGNTKALNTGEGQYFEDFTGTTVDLPWDGVTLVPEPSSDPPAYPVIRTNANSANDRVLEFFDAGGSRIGYWTIDALGAVFKEGEVYMRYAAENNFDSEGPVVFLDCSPTSDPEGARFDIRSGKPRVSYDISPNSTVTGSFSLGTQVPGLLSDFEWGHIRMRFYNNRVQMKQWEDLDPEPTEWQIDCASVLNEDYPRDERPLENLLVFGTQKSLRPVYIDKIGVGYGGASAPTASVVTGPATPINLGIANLLATSVRLTWEQG